MRRWAWALATIWLVAGSAVAADVVSAKADRVSVTIYRRGDLAEQIGSRDGPSRGSGLAMITETRTIDLPAGPAVIHFRGVADSMVAQTARIEGLPADVIERNFDYDLLSPGALVAKSIGKTVQVVRTNPKTGRATTASAVIRSGPDGVVLDFGQGRYEALNCSGLPERLVFDHAPDELSDTGVLSVRINAPSAGRYVIKLSYIATALNWTASYVARLDPAKQTLDLTGYITLANFGAVGFTDAPTDLIAAQIHAGEDEPIDPEVTELAESCWPVGLTVQPRVAAPPPVPVGLANSVSEVVVTGSRIPARALADYKLYALPEPTTVAAKQVKQIEFVDQPGAKYEHFYSATVSTWSGRIASDEGSDEDHTAPRSLIRLKNVKADGLGLALPDGTLAVLAPDGQGAMVFAGEGKVRDTPVAGEIELATGDALDLDVVRRITASRKVDGNQELDLEVVVDNKKAVPATLEIEHENSQDGLSVVRESDRHTMDSGDPVWRLRLKPGEHRVLHYTVRYPLD